MNYKEKLKWAGVIGICAATLGFAGIASADTSTSTMNMDTASSSGQNNSVLNSSTNNLYQADMASAQEVPPVNENVTGTTQVRFDNTNGSNMQFTLSVFNGTGITMAHLHCGVPGQNGPIVVTLFSNMTGVNSNGPLSSGAITDQAIASTSAGCSSTIGYAINNVSDLAKAIQEGKIYSNAHSLAHPEGVSRGQLVVNNTNNGNNNGNSGYQNGNNNGYNNGNYNNNDGSYGNNTSGNGNYSQNDNSSHSTGYNNNLYGNSAYTGYSNDTNNDSYGYNRNDQNNVNNYQNSDEDSTYSNNDNYYGNDSNYDENDSYDNSDNGYDSYDGGSCHERHYQDDGNQYHNSNSNWSDNNWNDDSED
jgi:hypothetical protein